jgi:hypothetical protein
MLHSMTVIARGSVTRHGRDLRSVFDLLGVDENHLTAAFGWTLACSPRLMAALLTRLGVIDPGNESAYTVDMEVLDDSGRTDLELPGPGRLLVIEAKRGWNLPSEEQLSRYASRILDIGDGQLVTLSDCSLEWAGLKLPREVAGVPVVHLPWSAVQSAIWDAIRTTGGHERLWLRQLHEYLRGALQVTEVDSAEVYCVVVTRQRFGDRTFRDYIDEGFYFFPYGWGHGWPVTPPNFLAFRWDSQVQRVCRVVHHEVVADLNERWPAIPPAPKETAPHVVCRLGPPLRMAPLPAGRNYRATRLWVLLDQLFTAATLEEAHIASQRLRGEAPPPPGALST